MWKTNLTFSHGTGFNAARDFAKQPRLELTGKHETFAMLCFFLPHPQSPSQFGKKIVKTDTRAYHLCVPGPLLCPLSNVSVKNRQ